MVRLLPDGSGTQTSQIYVPKLKSVITDGSNNGVSSMTWFIAQHLVSADKFFFERLTGHVGIQRNKEQ